MKTQLDEAKDAIREHSNEMGLRLKQLFSTNRTSLLQRSEAILSEYYPEEVVPIKTVTMQLLKCARSMANLAGESNCIRMTENLRDRLRHADDTHLARLTDGECVPFRVMADDDDIADRLSNPNKNLIRTIDSERVYFNMTYWFTAWKLVTNDEIKARLYFGFSKHLMDLLATSTPQEIFSMILDETRPLEYVFTATEKRIKKMLESNLIISGGVDFNYPVRNNLGFPRSVENKLLINRILYIHETSCYDEYFADRMK